MLGYLMYRSGLVPRRMAMLGARRRPLVALSGIAVLLGLYEQVSPWLGRRDPARVRVGGRAWRST